jgi:hypothetical protein
MVESRKFHDITRPGQEADIDELFQDLFKRIGQLQILTAKGDIITYDGTNYVRLARGSNGQVLTSRDSASAGLAWEDRAVSSTGVSNGALRYWLNGLPWGVI